MAKRKSVKASTDVLRSNFNFGGVMAERDPLLSNAYWDNGDYEAVASHDDPRCFIVGRTGSGKSAAFQHLEEMNEGKVIRVAPENLSLPYLTNLTVVQNLRGLGVKLDPFIKALWRHIFLVELLKFRYRIQSPEAKQNILSQLKDRFSRDQTKQKALDYLNEFGDHFWCETDERVKQIAESFETKIKAATEGEAKVAAVAGAKASGSIEASDRQEIRTELVAKYQRVVNESQLARLNAMMDVLNEEVFDHKYPLVYLIVDDLDKDWVDNELLALMLRCLFETVIDMQRIRRVKILVALRTNLIEYLRYSDSGYSGQEEKIRGLVLPIHWVKGDLKALLETRASVAAEFYGLEKANKLSNLLPRPNPTRGDALEYILERTLMRPRDGILFLNQCASAARGRARMTWAHILAAEKEYSKDRLAALRDEWRVPYAGLDEVLHCFWGKGRHFQVDSIVPVLDEVALLGMTEGFIGQDWLRPLVEPILDADRERIPWRDIYGGVVEVLYDIGFLGIGVRGQGSVEFSHDDEHYSSLSREMTQKTTFAVHRAFWEALALSERPLAGGGRA